MRSWESPEDDWIAKQGRPRDQVVAEIESAEREADRLGLTMDEFLRREARRVEKRRARRLAEYFGVGPEGDAA